MQPVELGMRRELFVDDYLVERMDNVRFDLKHPERREAFTFDAPWESANAWPYSVVAEKDVVRLYYRAGIRNLMDEDRSAIVALAESADGGLSFSRPVLGLCEFEGARANNILGIGTPGVPPAFLDANPRCAADARYKGLNAIAGQIYAMGSPDGLRWRLLREGPLDYPGAFDTINTAFWDPVAGCYRSYTRAWVNRETGGARERVRIIQSATSPDFIHWSRPVPNVYADGEAGVQLYTNAALPCPGAEHLYLSFPCRFMERRRRWVQRADGERCPVEGQGCNDGLFMASRDGVHWTRYADAWVRPGPDERNWTHRNNYPAWGIVPTSPTEWSMYVSEHYAQPDAPGRVRRLAVRPHGFVAIHADHRGGAFTTRPFTFTGRCLRLNYSTSSAGDIRIEIQDPDGRAIEGFALDDMEPVFGDEVDGGMTWKRGSDLGALAGRPVRLRVALRDADVFALRFGPREPGVSRCEVMPQAPLTYRTAATRAEVSIRRAPGPVVPDGDLAEWDLSGAVTVTPPDAFADRCHARIAFMYDAGALYVAGSVADPYPMANTLGFDGDMRLSWSSDALQFHIGAIADGPGAPVNDVRLWYSTRDGRAGCCVVPGTDIRKAVLNPPGVQGAYRRRADGCGYEFEYRIPWQALNSTRAPRPGERATACIQCHWGTERGDGLMCGVVDVRSDSSREAYEPQSWGQAVFD